jgi:zinc transport system permease protein
MSLDFLHWAVLGGLGLAVLAGPLGSLMVWQRLAYFGDTLAHGALLGAAAGLWWQLGSGTAILLTGLMLAILLLALERSRLLPADTLLGILSHAALALGLAILGRYWNALVAITVQEDLARVEGIRVDVLRAGHRLLLAAVVAVGIKAVGALLITALLLVPAAAARRLAQSPEQMAIAASFLAALAVGAGLGASWWLDRPVGPSIVMAASLLFVVTLARRPA